MELASWMIKLLILAVFGTVVWMVASCGILRTAKFTPDSPVEEWAEAMIQKETGVDLDLTPNSPER